MPRTFVPHRFGLLPNTFAKIQHSKSDIKFSAHPLIA
jgi:hypothetical protein